MNKENYLKTLAGETKLSVGLNTYLSMVVSELRFKKNEIIHLDMYFLSVHKMISSGAARIYTRDELTAKESTLLLIFENEFLPDLKVDQYSEPKIFCHFTENTTLIGFEAKHLPTLFKIFPEMLTIHERQNTAQLLRLYSRIFSFTSLDATARYQDLEINNKSAIKRMNLKYLSNFLGIDMTTLGRIRLKLIKRRHLSP